MTLRSIFACPPRCRRGPIRFAPVLIALAACSSPDSTLGPDPDFAATYGNGDPVLAIKVVDANGDRVKDATVRVYTIQGPVGTQNTDRHGLAKFHIPAGDYCVSVRVAPAGWTSLDIVTPPSQLDYTPVGTLHGPVVSVASEDQMYSEGGSADVSWVPVSDDTFRSCYEEPPVHQSHYGGFYVAELGEPYVVSPEIKGLNGETLTGIDVYAVIPVTVPWATTEDTEIQTAFFSLVGRTASPVDMVVSPGERYAIEFQQPFGGFNITGTAKGMASGSSGSPLEMEAAPLMCEETTETFPQGAKGIDFLQAAYGYHATLALGPDPSRVPVQLKHVGNGAVTVTFRTDLPHGRLTTTVDFECENGECGPATVKTPGKNHQTVQVFHMLKDDGVIKTTIVLGDVPAEHERVLFAAKSRGDRIPLTARNTATDAFFILERPSRCSVRQSNDDKWAVGDI